MIGVPDVLHQWINSLTVQSNEKHLYSGYK